MTPQQIASGVLEEKTAAEKKVVDFSRRSAIVSNRMAQTGIMGGSLTIKVNGSRLRGLRKDRKLKQYEVQQEIGLPPGRLTQYESGKPAPIEHLLKLGRFFGCEGRELADPDALRINKSLMLDLVEFHGARLDYSSNGGEAIAPAEQPEAGDNNPE